MTAPNAHPAYFVPELLSRLRRQFGSASYGGRQLGGEVKEVFRHWVEIYPEMANRLWGGTGSWPRLVSPETMATLHAIVLRQGAVRTLETGFGSGQSTFAICSALRRLAGRRRHTAIDPAQVRSFPTEPRGSWRGMGLQTIRSARLTKYLEFIGRPNYEALPELLSRKQRWQFAFIDGMHTYDNVLLDFFYCDLLLAPGSFIAFDDLWLPGVWEAVCWILTNRNYKLLHLNPHPYTEQLTVLKKIDDDARPWDFHRVVPGKLSRESFSFARPVRS